MLFGAGVSSALTRASSRLNLEALNLINFSGDRLRYLKVK